MLCLPCTNKPEQGKFQWVMQWGRHREEVTLRLGLQTWNRVKGQKGPGQACLEELLQRKATPLEFSEEYRTPGG